MEREKGLNNKGDKVKKCLLISLLILTGCATQGTNGVQPAGNNQFIIGGLGKFTDFSGSTVKARYIQEATEYCKSKGDNMEIISSTSKDAENGHYASAEIIFKCTPIK